MYQNIVQRPKADFYKILFLLTLVTCVVVWCFMVFSGEFWSIKVLFQDLFQCVSHRSLLFVLVHQTSKQNSNQIKSTIGLCTILAIVSSLVWRSLRGQCSLFWGSFQCIKNKEHTSKRDNLKHTPPNNGCFKGYFEVSVIAEVHAFFTLCFNKFYRPKIRLKTPQIPNNHITDWKSANI